MSVSESTAAPTEFESKGKKFNLYPLRFENWGEVERWIKDEMVMRGKRAIADAILTASQRDSIMAVAFRESREVSIIDYVLEGGKTPLTTLEGMLRVIHQSVNRGQENKKLWLTISDIEDWLGGSVKTTMSVYKIVRDISYPEYFQEPTKDALPVNPPPPVKV
jgi:hypothetical protein